MTKSNSKEDWSVPMRVEIIANGYLLRVGQRPIYCKNADILESEVIRWLKTVAIPKLNNSRQESDSYWIFHHQNVHAVLSKLD